MKAFWRRSWRALQVFLVGYLFVALVAFTATFVSIKRMDSPDRQCLLQATRGEEFSTWQVSYLLGVAWPLYLWVNAKHADEAHDRHCQV